MNPQEEIAKLRLLLFMAHYTSGCYTDDGEMQDATERPFIDYKRDSPDAIKAALVERRKRRNELMGGNHE